jgi:hypothetical protein
MYAFFNWSFRSLIHCSDPVNYTICPLLWLLWKIYKHWGYLQFHQKWVYLRREKIITILNFLYYGWMHPVAHCCERRIVVLIYLYLILLMSKKRGWNKLNRFIHASNVKGNTACVYNIILQICTDSKSIEVHAFQTSILGGGEWSVSCLGCFNSRNFLPLTEFKSLSSSPELVTIMIYLYLILLGFIVKVANMTTLILEIKI